jgi:DNA-binding GntR family transcriptional regulator
VLVVFFGDKIGANFGLRMEYMKTRADARKKRVRGARAVSQSQLPLADRIAEEIRKGAYRPGEWLRQIDLEERFSTSRFDIRTALNLLVAQQIIEHVPNRGYRVHELDNEGIHHIRAVRAILESAAIKDVARNIDQELLRKLRKIAEAFSSTVENGTPIELEKLNSEFHKQMYSASTNPILNDLIHQIRQRVNSLFVPTWPSLASLRDSAEQHHDILNALERRDVEAAANIISRHILKSDYVIKG